MRGERSPGAEASQGRHLRLFGPRGNGHHHPRQGWSVPLDRRHEDLHRQGPPPLHPHQQQVASDRGRWHDRAGLVRKPAQKRRCTLPHQARQPSGAWRESRNDGQGGSLARHSGRCDSGGSEPAARDPNCLGRHHAVRRADAVHDHRHEHAYRPPTACAGDEKQDAHDADPGKHLRRNVGRQLR